MFARIELQAHAAPEQVAQQRLQVGDRLAGIEAARNGRGVAGESKQMPHQGRAAPRRRADLRGILQGRRIEPGPGGHGLGRGQHHGQDVVEIMRKADREAPDHLHAPGLVRPRAPGRRAPGPASIGAAGYGAAVSAHLADLPARPRRRQT